MARQKGLKNEDENLQNESPEVAKEEPFTPASIEAVETLQPKRHFKTQGKVFHDLFKLKLSHFKKNIGLPEKPKWEKVEHCHYFHSYNSSGSKQTHSSSVGGHCHEVTVSMTEDGRLIAKCGPAYRKFRHNKGEILPDDKHTHEIEYVVSEEIEVRKKNNKANNFINAYMESFTTPPAPQGDTSGQ